MHGECSGLKARWRLKSGDAKSLNLRMTCREESIASGKATKGLKSARWLSEAVGYASENATAGDAGERIWPVETTMLHVWHPEQMQKTAVAVPDVNGAR